MRIYLYVGKCCREWPMPYGYAPRRCGLCGEVPHYLREADPPYVDTRPPIDERTAS